MRSFISFREYINSTGENEIGGGGGDRSFKGIIEPTLFGHHRSDNSNPLYPKNHSSKFKIA